MKMVAKNKLRQAITNLVFLRITKKVKQVIAVNNNNNCHFEMYRLYNLPRGKSEKK